MIKTWLLKAFDGLELVKSTDIQMDAPKHFHDGYAIGTALSGLQTIQLRDESNIIAPGALMFLDPHEIHGHEAIPGAAWSHRMLYISPEYIEWLQKRKLIYKKEKLHFDVSMANRPDLFNLFNNCHALLSDRYISYADVQMFDYCLARLFNQFASGKINKESNSLMARMRDIQYHIATNTSKNLDLDQLAKTFHLSKFSLIRAFRQFKGITPNEYLTIMRVEKAKRFIFEGNSLVCAALEAGFYDQSHFSHNFLKYTSFTPGQFKKACA